MRESVDAGVQEPSLSLYLYNSIAGSEEEKTSGLLTKAPRSCLDRLGSWTKYDNYLEVATEAMLMLSGAKKRPL